MFKRMFPRSGKRGAAADPPHPGPDDAPGIVPAPESVRAHIAEMRAQREEFLAALNEEMPKRVTLVPWAMLPWKIWNGPHGRFLAVSCELYPVGPWNTMLLPDDDDGASALNLPKHLGDVPPGLEAAVNDLIGEVREDFAEVHESAGAATALADTPAHDELAATRDAARAKLGGLAGVMGARVYGEDAYARHRELFGKKLGWPGGD